MERLDQWSERINGAMALLNIFEEAGIAIERGMGKDTKVYSDAIYEMLKDKRNMSMFLDGEREIHYKNHKRDKKGRLVYVEAYIGEREDNIQERGVAHLD